MRIPATNRVADEATPPSGAFPVAEASRIAVAAWVPALEKTRMPRTNPAIVSPMTMSHPTRDAIQMATSSSTTT